MTAKTENLPADRATLLGVIQKLLAVVVFWGANVVVLKILTAYFEPLALVTLRMVLSTLLILPLVVLRTGFVRLPARAWVSVLGVGLLTFTLHQMAMTWGIARTSGTHGVLILGLMPLATMVLANLLLKERMSPAKLIGIALGFGGITLIALAKEGGQGVTLEGDALLGLAVLCYAVGSIFVKKGTADASPLVITAYGLGVSALMLLAVCLFSGTPWIKTPAAFDWGPVAGLLFVSWFSTAVGTLWWNVGIHRLGATTTSLFFNGVPIVGVAASAAFLGEQILIPHILALGLILVGISLGSGIVRAPAR